jgi:hypothetical protein
VPAGIRSTTLGSGAKASQRASSQLVAGKRKANELASSGPSSRPPPPHILVPLLSQSRRLLYSLL